MAKLSKEELIDAFKEMTLLELSEFVKEFEDVFDVEAAAPAAVAVAAPGAAGGEDAAEEKTEFDVVLEAAGDKKIAVIKALRALQPGLALKEAKEKVDSAPTTVLEGASKEDAEKAKADLEGAGATVTLK
ncbi:50S ribosomal protein L7/L12 [Varibaculum vaginae]|uniref:50S ribosomal protein L7/L12 n=1 Tax=Varibaculum vaginae TaxID=2364797 RepID=UPI000F07B70B|nr:50S ribosomal protein L7/L12 [Varibaculum vaginae]